MKAINEINIEPRNSITKFSRFSNGVSNGSVSIPQFFSVAKTAKRNMEMANLEIENIKISDTIPAIYKSVLKKSISSISSSYLTLAGAFNLAMDFAKNPYDRSYAEAYVEDMKQGTEMYKTALNNILEIQKIYTSKKTRKNR